MAAVHQTSRLLAWYRGARPRTLTATYVPMGLAAVIALNDGMFDLLTFVLALIGALLLQIAANLVNEYADYRRGADEFKEAGQGMAIKQKILPPGQILLGAILTVSGGALIGLCLAAQSGLLVLWIGIGGVLVVIMYTAGPFPLAYHGLGEVAVGIFMGPEIVIGAYYVMAKTAYVDQVLLSLPIAFMVAAILHANNIRDLEADRAVNKRTLAVIFGRHFARAEFIFLVGATYVSVILLVVAGKMPWPTLIVFLTLPEASKLIHIFNTSTDVSLMHQAQGRTARLHGRVGLLLFVGWLVFLALQKIFG